MSAHQYDEGHTVAGWTGFAVVTLGTVVLGLGVCTASLAILVGGLAIVVVSVLVTWTLHLTGWGKPPGLRPREQWGWRTRDLTARAGHPGCVGCRLAGRGRKAMPAAEAYGASPEPVAVPESAAGPDFAEVPESAAVPPSGP
ncbi:HGxxPAAW family protein [Streptomyces sp. NPDC006476]|uniref:HGxxPAAW family protein n=1 Tax=Streptomyces sp. NPDC006476 TaxID=3157175 RepID=UPI0033BCB714